MSNALNTNLIIKMTKIILNSTLICVLLSRIRDNYNRLCLTRIVHGVIAFNCERQAFSKWRFIGNCNLSAHEYSVKLINRSTPEEMSSRCSYFVFIWAWNYSTWNMYSFIVWNKTLNFVDTLLLEVTMVLYMFNTFYGSSDIALKLICWRYTSKSWHLTK